MTMAWWIDLRSWSGGLGRGRGRWWWCIRTIRRGTPRGVAERARLQEICVRHGLALIVDEVFLDYGLARKIETVVCDWVACVC